VHRDRHARSLRAYLKNVDLVEQFGAAPGFWNSFAAGVDLIEVADGQLHMKLKE
jgi:hypothetical protein